MSAAEFVSHIRGMLRHVIECNIDFPPVAVMHLSSTVSVCRKCTKLQPSTSANFTNASIRQTDSQTSFRRSDMSRDEGDKQLSVCGHDAKVSQSLSLSRLNQPEAFKQILVHLTFSVCMICMGGDFEKCWC